MFVGNLKHNPIICALDTSDFDQDINWVNTVKEYVGMVKVGFELFTGEGLPLLAAIELKNIPIFLDLKFYDTPNTVYKTVQTFNKFTNIEMLTVHASGDLEMIFAAVEAAGDIDVIEVTVLTSSDKQTTTKKIVKKLTEKALEASASGLGCAAIEVKALRKAFGSECKIKRA